MSFEKIGPYRLSTSDSVAASLVIGFRIAGRNARIVVALLAIVLLVAIITESAFGEFWMAGLAALLLLYVFVLAPALRARKGTGSTCLTFDPDGLVAETEAQRTTYKWATIGSVRKIGSRLFIMVNARCALVVPNRVTSADNMRALIDSLTTDRLPK